MLNLYLESHAYVFASYLCSKDKIIDVEMSFLFMLALETMVPRGIWMQLSLMCIMSESFFL